MDKKAAVERIAQLVKQMQAAQNEAVELATEHKLCFDMHYTTYGAGVTFDGTAVGEKNYWGDESNGWLASSQAC